MKYTFLVFISFLLLSCTNNSSTDATIVVKSDIMPPVIAKSEKMKEKQITSKSIDEVMGRFEPKSHTDFVLIDKKYADRAGLYMQKEAYSSFVRMWEHAGKEGIILTIRSATRNFDYQRGIWERKWTGKTKVEGQSLNETEADKVSRARKILEYSSMPGTSRHHWGTDIDLNAFENSYFEQGSGKAVYSWLTANAKTYGFCQPYTEKGKDRPEGYNEEKWHWSYMPVAEQYFDTASSSMNDEMITGFQGSKTAVEIGVVQKYILGVSHQCK